MHRIKPADYPQGSVCRAEVFARTCTSSNACNPRDLRKTGILEIYTPFPQDQSINRVTDHYGSTRCHGREKRKCANAKMLYGPGCCPMRRARSTNRHGHEAAANGSFSMTGTG